MSTEARHTKSRELLVLTLPVVWLAGLGVLAHFSGYKLRTPVDAYGFIRAAMAFQRPSDFYVLLWTLMGIGSVITVLVMFLQHMLDKVAPPFEKPRE